MDRDRAASDKKRHGGLRAPADRKSALNRRIAALLRGLLVAVMVAAPSVLLPGASIDGREMAALIALIAGLLTFAEYAAPSASLIAFRDVPPFNRLRFFMMFATVLFLTAIARDMADPTGPAGLAHRLGAVIGQAMDVPLDPVRLMTIAINADGQGGAAEFVGVAAGIGYLCAMATLFAFVLILRLTGWPVRAGAVNIWVNLPTFDPLAGDLAERLDRNARVNLVLGITMPFLIPVGVGVGLGQALSSPQALIWVMAAWAFVPTSLVMRAIALARLAELVRAKRRLHGPYSRQAGLALA